MIRNRLIWMMNEQEARSMDFNQFIAGNHFYQRHSYEGNPYYWQFDQDGTDPVHFYPEERQKVVRGQATWTEGGQYTKCGIPWSYNGFMTGAVGENSPYRCGEVIQVSSPETGKAIHVTVVDEVQGYPSNKINLHRRAFEALGANLDVGILDVQIVPGSTGEDGRLEEKLEEVVRFVYPNATIRSYQPIDRKLTEVRDIQEKSDFVLEVNGKKRTVRGEMTYQPESGEVVSIHLYPL